MKQIKIDVVREMVPCKPEEVIDDLIKFGKCSFGAKLFFFHNGKPYRDLNTWVSKLDGTEWVQFRSYTLSAVKNVLDDFYGCCHKAYSDPIRVDSIVGYELVDVWVDRKFKGTFRNIITKKED